MNRLNFIHMEWPIRPASAIYRAVGAIVVGLTCGHPDGICYPFHTTKGAWL